jgi:phospholipid/cholesterol/gamma-HCH transport system substrate-binding protein
LSEKRSEILIGTFILLAVILLIATIFWGKHRDFMSRHDYLSVRFENIRGLMPGDPVMVRGIKKGEVEAVTLETGYALVKCRIKSDIVLYDDMRLFLESRDPMGAMQVTIVPGSSRRDADLNEHFIGERTGGIPELLSGFTSVVMTADTLLSGLRDLLGAERLNRTLSNLEEASIDIKKLLSDNAVTISETIGQLHQFSDQLIEDSTGVKMRRTLALLDSSASHMSRLFKAVDEEGTLSELIHDKTLHTRLLHTTEKLDSLIDDIKLNPKKYLHFSLF